MQRAFPSVRRTLAEALILGHLFAAVLAWSPSLHHWLHGDSDEPDHHCAVTALLDGQFDRSTVLAVAAKPPTLSPETDPLLISTPEPLVAPRSGVRGRAPPLG